LAHLLANNEGFPGLGFRSFEYENLASSLSSMVLDLVVSDHLIPYCFDLVEELHSELRESRRQLVTIVTTPTEPLKQLHWAANYASHLLDIEKLSDKESKEATLIIELIEKRHPKISEKAKQFFNLVISTGYTQPSQVVEIFHAIVIDNNLGKFLQIL
jgi:hypothetical protein